MNAYMNISVRVLSANAQAQIKALQTQVRALEGQLARANAVSAAPNGIGSIRQRKSMMAWGNQIQWTGRQLQYNWTLPLLLAGGAAVKFALDNEKAFTRVKKVYGDTQDAAAQFNKEAGRTADAQFGITKAKNTFTKELNSLEGAFEALSTRYGVNQAEVLETAGAWAAAGASGIALARSTQISLKAAILGDIELGKATESLIAIQAQYSLSTQQLSLTLAELNAIENQTGISMQGLIDGFARSAGVAREAGVDVRHLAAMLAALVPATGSAANAGNSLKTIISRLMSPTKDAADVMHEFGVNTQDAAWQSSTAVERLTILAGHMGDSLKKAGNDSYVLSDSQKQVVASVLGSRYQMNRFLVLMREMGPTASYYEKALGATSDRTKVFAQASKELNKVLDSSPRRLSIIWATLQNGMADAVQPMIPYLLYLAESVSKMVTWFSNLNPEVQKFSMVMLIALAAVGPLVRYFGSLLTLFGAMALPFKMLIGLWVSFATVSKVVDGAVVTTRRTLLGMMMSLIKWPFAKIGSGFGLLIGWILSLGKSLFSLGPITQAASAVMAGAPMAISGAWAASAVVIKAMWARTIAAMVLINSIGVVGIVRNWLIGMVLMSKGTTAVTGTMAKRWAAFVATLKGMSLGMSVLFSRQMFIPLLMGMARLTTAVELAWTAMWVSMRAIMSAGQIALLALGTGFRLMFLSGWAGLYVSMIAMPTKAQALIVRGWVAFMTGLRAVMIAGGAAMRATWALMHIAMAAMSTAFWSKVIRIWIIGMTALPKALAVIRGGLATVWATIVALQRTGALAAAAAAAGPWVLAAAAIVGVFFLFRDQIGKIWDNLVAYFSDSTNDMTSMVLRAWNALPQGVSNALVAVARIVQQAALQIYEWFSYINPFARHSPSLVENVTEGMKVVGQQFGNAAGVIGGHVRGAYADIKAFGAAVKGIMNGAASFEQAQERASIKKFAPGALEEYDALARRLALLQGDLARLQGRMDKQQAVVDRWTAAVDRANAAIDRQQDKLDRLSKIQDKWQAKLESAQEKLDKYASAPIAGMGAMSNKIFENEMAQKRLRLEMMKMEEAGGGLDSIRSKIEAINGAQELLRGEKNALRNAGAGSEILDQYDAQIAALEATKNQQNEAADAIENMTTQLAQLERQGEILDLENSLAFDPLTRQIEAAAIAMEELPFAQIMAGVTAASADIAYYGEKLDAATAAVNSQQAVVDRLTEARDRLQARLDREEDTLGRIKEQYDKVNDAIGDVESTMQGAASAAETLGRKAEEAAAKAKKAAGGAGYTSPAVQNFRDAAGGNFASVGGSGIPTRGNWKDQSKQIEKFTQQIADKSANAFGGLNPFAPIKRKWGDFKSWWNGAWGEIKSSTSDMFSNMFSGVGGSGGFTAVVDKFRIAWANVSEWFKKNVFNPLVSVWRLFWPSIKEFFQNAWKGIQDIWDSVGPELGSLFKEFAKMGPAFKGLWNILKPILAIVGGALAIIAKLIINVLAKTIRPALALIGDVIGAIIRVIKGAVQIVSGFFMLFNPGTFKEGLKKMMAGVVNIFGGMIDAVWSIIKNGVKIIGGVFWGIVDGIIDAAKWLWDKMVGHSIIPDLIDGIIWWFKKIVTIVKWVWSYVIVPLFTVFRKLLDGVIALVKLWWIGITAAWSVLKTLGVWLWDNVLKPVWNKITDLWGKVGPALAAWWERIKYNWSLLKALGVWLWDNVLKPVWNKITDLWDKVGPALALWWEGVKIAWAGLMTAGQWLWDNVLKPVWNKITDLWGKVGPALAAWWERVKKNWNTLKTMGQWIWDNVLKPVWNKITDLWGKVGPEIRAWWERVKTAWNTLKTMGTWFWNNVVKPVYDKVVKVFGDIKTNMGNWWEGITNVFSKGKGALTGLGKWFYDNVMGPVLQKVKDVFNGIKTWLTENKDMLTKPVESIVNVVIKAVNAIISGLNKVADVLPGIDWEIKGIPELARGGRVPNRQGNRGFKTNGARAIVGEGKANHPEFVIPTDPTHRARAKSLLGMAAKKLGVMGRSGGTGLKNAQQMSEHGVPMFSIGGWLGDRYDDAKGLANEIAKIPARAVGKVMDPALNAARNQVKDKTQGWKPIQSPPLFAIDKIAAWVKETDASAAKAVKAYSTPVGGNVSVPNPANPSGRMVWKGGTFSNKFVAHMQKAEQLAGASISVMQGGFRPYTSYSGRSHEGDAVDLQANANLIRSLRRVGIAAGDRTGLGEWASHAHAVPGPGAGYAAGSAPWQFQDYMARGGMNQALNSPWGLKSGGIALAKHGPTAALLGDGRHDEAVVPLPKGWRSEFIGSTQGGSTININGDLLFPNIKSGNDAEAFIENLKILAGD